jgi:hypothetical protein
VTTTEQRRVIAKRIDEADDNAPERETRHQADAKLNKSSLNRKIDASVQVLVQNMEYCWLPWPLWIGAAFGLMTHYFGLKNHLIVFSYSN